jgi:hypothetical protein
MKSTKLIAICFLFSVAFLGPLGAIDFQVPAATDIAGFGTILATQGSSNAKELQKTKPGFVPRSDIALKTEYPEIKAPSSGTVIYSQRESPVASVFSFPLGRSRCDSASGKLHQPCFRPRSRYCNFQSGRKGAGE